MNVSAYRLYDQAVKLQPAAAVRTGRATDPTRDGDLALARTSQRGWDLLCPLAFTATWNGGPRPEDIDIRREGAITIGAPAFVQSQLGDGLLTFYPGYQFKTEGDHLLWLRGPLNVTKDGLAPLESLIDAALLPCTVALHWQFTRPHQTIRFEAGEPFATLLLYPKPSLDSLRVEVMQHVNNADAHAQDFQQMVDTPALRAVFQRLSATPAVDAQDAKPTPRTKTTQAAEPPPAGCFDTIDGCIDLRQFDPDFFVPERFWNGSTADQLRRYGEIRQRMFYVIDPLKLAYLSIPKVACTAIRMALAPASGISFDRSEGFEYRLYIDPHWRRVAGKLNRAQSGYYRFSFVRNPFDRLVSCYRSKVIYRPSPNKGSPHFQGYFFAIPANISFADFAGRVSQIPDALADAHFKSQYALLYSAGELQVDYLGKFERLADDWRPIAERYQLEPLLEAANVSKNKPGCLSDYRLYYTEPLVQLVYERYRMDVHAFGYEDEYEQLLAFVCQQSPNAVSVPHSLASSPDGLEPPGEER